MTKLFPDAKLGELEVKKQQQLFTDKILAIGIVEFLTLNIQLNGYASTSVEDTNSKREGRGGEGRGRWGGEGRGGGEGREGGGGDGRGGEGEGEGRGSGGVTV